jgi:hypothetical protein
MIFGVMCEMNFIINPLKDAEKKKALTKDLELAQSNFEGCFFNDANSINRSSLTTAINSQLMEDLPKLLQYGIQLMTRYIILACLYS